MGCMVFWAAMPATAENPMCDFRSAWRGEQVVGYVPNVHLCLEAPHSEVWFDEAVERDIFERVNAARKEAGVPPLQYRAALLMPARIHSLDMAHEDFFDHQGPDGREVKARVAALDRHLVFSEIRENIAAIGGDIKFNMAGKILHTQLFNSDGHRQNMLAPNLTHMAIGLARTDRGAWVTQVFVREEGELIAPLPLRLDTSVQAVPQADLKAWKASGISLRNVEGREQAYELFEPYLLEDLDLVVLGVKELDGQILSGIKLFGPSVSVEPALEK